MRRVRELVAWTTRDARRVREPAFMRHPLAVKEGARSGTHRLMVVFRVRVASGSHRVVTPRGQGRGTGAGPPDTDKQDRRTKRDADGAHGRGHERGRGA
jgi:hypothetical protein